jgi:trehalose utilization protein
MVSVTVWNEYVHERESDAVGDVYPDGIHGAIADALRSRGHDVETATLDAPDHGLPPARLDRTDVLLWWGHAAHDRVDDRIADRVREHVLDGMGFIALHSAHRSKPFRRLIGTDCGVNWRIDGDRERLWIVEPGHPIAAGLGEYVELPETETYGEPFDVPAPDVLVFVSWFAGGEVFRSGCGYRRGNGRVFYFRPGHETYPVYHDTEVQQVLDNAVGWAAPAADATRGDTGRQPPDADE